MKNRKIKLILTSTIFVLLLVFIWLSTYGINKNIEKNISVDVYKDNDWSHTTSSITISGNLKQTLFSTNFVGTFAIDYYEPSCRDGVEAKIEWYSNDYQDITFFYAGDFSRFDVEMIDIDKEMNSMMIILKDGTIITSPNYYIPTKIWEQYKN